MLPYGFNSPKHPHQISAQDTFYLFFRITAIQEALRDVRIAAHVLKLRRQFADAIKIGTQPDRSGPATLAI